MQFNLMPPRPGGANWSLIIVENNFSHEYWKSKHIYRISHETFSKGRVVIYCENLSPNVNRYIVMEGGKLEVMLRLN
jgi:hypothetical protein